jgi:hypothetical protein
MTLDLVEWTATYQRLRPGEQVVVQGLFKDGLALEHLGFEIRDCLHVVTVEGVEQWWLCRKGFEGSVSQNVLKHGVGALNIDGCRVAGDLSGLINLSTGKPRSGIGYHYSGSGGFGGTKANPPHFMGRWPPNLIFIHASGCQRVGTRTVETPVINRFTDGMKPFGNGAGHAYVTVRGGSGTEELPVYACAEGCPVAALDAQSGHLKSAVGKPGLQKTNKANVNFNGRAWSIPGQNQFGDEGGASRFFPCFESREGLTDWLNRLIMGAS